MKLHGADSGREEEEGRRKAERAKWGNRGKGPGASKMAASLEALAKDPFPTCVTQQSPNLLSFPIRSLIYTWEGRASM